jgi:hypothetical protein
MRAKMIPAFLASAALGVFASGCGLAGNMQNSSSPASTSAAANVGESEGTIPAGAPEAGSSHPAATPRQAIVSYASLYINWSYRTLARQEAQLAGMAVGDARLAEQQAAAQAKRDSTITQARVYNRGSVVTVGPVVGGSSGDYVLVTREETGGSPEYAGLQAAFHITLVTVTRTRGGWAVSEWLPQN